MSKGPSAYLGHHFVAGLDDESKIEMVQVYLHDKTSISFPHAKIAVVQSYHRIGRAHSTFMRTGAHQCQLVEQNDVNAELLLSSKPLQMHSESQQSQIKEYFYRPTQPPQVLFPSLRQLSAYRPRGRLPPRVFCHSHVQEGHFSSSWSQFRGSWGQ